MPPDRLSLLLKVVEAALKIPALATPADRDVVLKLLRRGIVDAVTRGSTLRTDVTHIVCTCAEYQDGLLEFANAVRFFADHTIAMAELDAAIADYLDGLQRPPTV